MVFVRTKNGSSFVIDAHAGVDDAMENPQAQVQRLLCEINRLEESNRELKLLLSDETINQAISDNLIYISKRRILLNAINARMGEATAEAIHP